MTPLEIVGPYQLGEKLGKGGMGSVYRAVHVKSKDPVAVKIIAAQVADEPRFRRRFDAEVKTLMKLRHPHIVKLIGFGEEHGQLFYSMELVEGESLQGLIKRKKKLSWLTCINFAVEVCEALKHAHDMGVIHRDLKPANLIVTDDQHIKLVDFGIAKIFGDSQNTMVGSLLGTLDYMAPEQVDSVAITARTDLYAVGSLMYAMLVGRPPFRGKNATQVLDMLKNQPPTRLELIDPDLPEPLIELIHELLEKNPNDRPPTALAVTKRLKSMRAGLSRASESSSGTTNPTDQPVLPDSSGSDSPGSEPMGTLETQPVSDSAFPNVTKQSIDRVTQNDEALTILPGSDLVEPRVTAKTNVTGVGTQRGNDSQINQSHDGNTGQPTILQETLKTEMNSDFSVELAPELQTHFQIAEEAQRKERKTQLEQTNSRPWAQWISVAGMALVLIFCVSLLINSMRPPSADTLYQQATQADNRSASRVFLKNYPNDPRRTEVQDRLMLAEIESAIKRISAQQKIGIKDLSAAEEAFLLIFQTEETGTAALSTEKLESWKTAFSVESETPSTNSLFNLVDYEIKRRSAGRPDPRQDSSLSDLMSKIDAIVALPDGEETQKQLQALAELFGNSDWAKPALIRIGEIQDERGHSVDEDSR
ncbi:serine/threonine protein kinase [bacterium]|nr:serine/threonine protein kinase [bacterium]